MNQEFCHICGNFINTEPDRAINHGMGWECDRNNDYLLKVLKKYEKVRSLPKEIKEKIHKLVDLLIEDIKRKERI